MTGGPEACRRSACGLLIGALLGGLGGTLWTARGRAAADARGALAHGGLMAASIEACAKALLLVALEIAPGRYLEELARSRNRLDSALQVQLAAEAARPSALTTLWPAYDDILLNVLESRRASPRLVAAMIEIRQPLGDAALSLFESRAGQALQEPRSASLIRAYREVLALNWAAQRIASDFLLAASRLARPETGATLAGAARVLEAGLTGLDQGDPQRRLVPAPTQGIRAQLRAAQASWSDCRRELEAAAWGRRPHRPNIAGFALANDRLSQDLKATLELYDAL